MHKLPFWLVIGTFLLLSLAACGGADGAETAETAVCDFTNQTAVTLNLRDENGNPQRLVRVRYRVDDGPWQETPERVNGTAVLRGGPGTYQIQVEKPGYAPNEMTVVVPEPETESCELVGETAVLPMSLATCPDMNLANLEIEIVTEGDEVTVTAVAQPGGSQPLTCTTDTATTCTLTLPGAGQLLLTAENLGGIGPMQVNEGIVSYALRNSQLTLRQNNVERTVTLSGAESLSAVLDVALDEVGCPLTDFRTLEVQAEPDVASGEPFPALRVIQLSNLTITDLSAAACQATPQPYPVRFEAELPNGTPLANVSVQTFSAGEWQVAECEVVNGRFLCTANLPNPLLNQPYAYKIVAGDEEYTGSSLPFDNLCLLFE